MLEQTSSLIPTIEFNHEIVQAENHLFEYLREFHLILNEKFRQSRTEKDNNFQLLRPTFANPTKKHHLQKIDQQEKVRQDDIEIIINRLQSNTIVNETFQKINNILLLFGLLIVGRCSNECEDCNSILGYQWRTVIDSFR